MTVRILQGDCREALATLPAASVHCCVTSPPYWGLRSYLPDDDPRKPLELGNEATPDQYVETMVEVFEAVRRVLRQDGTLWLNLGDSYIRQQAGGQGPAGCMHGRGVTKARGDARAAVKAPGLARKQMVGIPWRVALALQAAGWWLRSDIVWHKPTPIPESVTDRPTSAHEFVFLLAKSAAYYYDAGAIRERATAGHAAGNRAGYRRDERASYGGRGGAADTIYQWRAARDVWTIRSEPYPGPHYAVFPTALATRCVLAGCPEGGTVLDPFGGSGTVGEVATALGRAAVLVELDPRSVELAEERCAQQGLFAR